MILYPLSILDCGFIWGIFITLYFALKKKKAPYLHIYVEDVIPTKKDVQHQSP